MAENALASAASAEQMYPDVIDHPSAQPFTRPLRIVLVPAEVRVVIIQAPGQKHGYGGKTVKVALPGRSGGRRK